MSADISENVSDFRAFDWSYIVKGSKQNPQMGGFLITLKLILLSEIDWDKLELEFQFSWVELTWLQFSSVRISSL